MILESLISRVLPFDFLNDIRQYLLGLWAENVNFI